MPADTSFTDLATPTQGARPAPIVSETDWGFVIRPAEPMLERAALFEMASTFGGVLVLLAAFGHWLLPGSNLTPDLVPLKLVSTLLFAGLGAGLVLNARQGMVRELHLDRAKRELRLVQRNRYGAGRLAGAFAFDDVATVALQPSAPFAAARLSLRLDRDDSTVDLLAADEAELLPIRDRLIVEMSPRFRAAPQRRSAA